MVGAIKPPGAGMPPLTDFNEVSSHASPESSPLGGGEQGVETVGNTASPDATGASGSSKTGASNESSAAAEAGAAPGTDGAAGATMSAGPTSAERMRAGRVASSVVAVDPEVQQIAHALRNGQIDASQAMEHMLEETLASLTGGAKLSPARQEAIKSRIRNHMTSDPAMMSMMQDLDRLR